MKPHRALIFIDKSNFYFKLRDLQLHNLLKFNFSSFAKSLISSNTLVAGNYYVGAVRTDGTPKTQELFNNQRKLFAHLKRHQFHYSLGYLLKSGGKFHEKGVDVNIAVDLLVAAYENLADTFFLILSDTDLLPAIQKAQEKRKQVVYIGFSHKLSLALVANCQETRTLTKNLLLPFMTTETKKAA
jgi:uncharacterized LabA/DUF88 family protein